MVFDTIGINKETFFGQTESILYQCTIQDEETDVEIYLTNYRLVYGYDNFIDCKLLSAISRFGMFYGRNDYEESEDLGSGDFGIYAGDINNYDTFWFTSKKAWKEFYEELSRAIMDLEASKV